MRHGDKVNNLSRTAAHRKALLSNLACQIIVHKRIITTIAKAKALRIYVEPLITKAKQNTTHQHRVIFSYLQNKEAIIELFGSVAERVGGRPGGYTRIIKLGTRTGDNAEMALIELVDFNDVYGKAAETAAQTGKRTRRSSRGKKSASIDATVAAPLVPQIVPAPEATIALEPTESTDATTALTNTSEATAPESTTAENSSQDDTKTEEKLP